MSGHTIVTDDYVLVVDKWDSSYIRRTGTQSYYFFLTHLHSDHIKGLTSSWSRIIYTSPFNAWLLPIRRNVKSALMKGLELNETHTIQNPQDGTSFQVTLFDANHCPGSVMFLFQGSFGNILYTGDFRYKPGILSNPPLQEFIQDKRIDVLYLDNTYAAPSCIFPTREEALKEVLKIVNNHPDSKIFIGLRQLGKEEVLKAIALHLNERICVSPQRLEIVTKLEYEDVFTANTSESRIHAIELHTVNTRQIQESSSVVSIKLTALYEQTKVEKKPRGLSYVVPYSDHSNHTELVRFVEEIRPIKIVPIVEPKLRNLKPEDLTPWSKMASVNCVIPEVIWDLCGNSLNLSPVISSQLSNCLQSCDDIRYHLSPREVRESSSSRRFSDEGSCVTPMDSIAPLLLRNNKAKLQIKRTWTRLAPKLLGPKGVTYIEGSPEKTDEKREMENVCNGTSKSSHGRGTKRKRDSEPRSPLSAQNKTPTGSDAESILEVPLSTGNEVTMADDDITDSIPISAKHLQHQLEMAIKKNCNNFNGPKYDCNVAIEDVVDSQWKENGELKVNELGCISSSKESSPKRCKIDKVVNEAMKKPNCDVLGDSSGKRTIETRNSKIVEFPEPLKRRRSKISPPTESQNRSGLIRRCISLENLAKIGNKSTPPKQSLEVKQKLTTNASKESLFNAVEGQGDAVRNLKIRTVRTRRSLAGDDECLSVFLTDSNEGSVKEDERPSRSIEQKSTALQDGGKVVIQNGRTESTDSPIVGNQKSTFNVISKHATKYQRQLLAAEVVEAMAKKETAEALKALEALDAMSTLKSRASVNRSNNAKLSNEVIALRMGSDKCESKKPMVITPVANTTKRRSVKTASILSSMAHKFEEANVTPKSNSPKIPLDAKTQVLFKQPLKKATSLENVSIETPKPIENVNSALRKVKATERNETNSVPTPIHAKPQILFKQRVKKAISVENVSIETVKPTENLNAPLRKVKGTEENETPKNNVDSGNAGSVNGDTEATTDSANNQDTDSVSPDPDNLIVRPVKEKFGLLRKHKPVNLHFMRLQMDIAMNSKEELLNRVKSSVSASPKPDVATQTKNKVDAWRSKISLLTKMVQRKYRTPQRLRPNYRILSIRKEKTDSSEAYSGDIESILDQSATVQIKEESEAYDGDVESTQDEKKNVNDISKRLKVKRLSRIASEVNERNIIKNIPIHRQSLRICKVTSSPFVRRKPLRLAERQARLINTQQILPKRLSSSSGEVKSHTLSQKSKDKQSSTIKDKPSELLKGIAQDNVSQDMDSSKTGRKQPPRACSTEKNASEPVAHNSKSHQAEDQDNSKFVDSLSSDALLNLIASNYEKECKTRVSETANILSSMAQNFKTASESKSQSASVASSLRSSRSKTLLVENSQKVNKNSNFNAPQSLCIELLSDQKKKSQKEPSPPSLSISIADDPELGLISDSRGEASLGLGSSASEVNRNKRIMRSNKSEQTSSMIPSVPQAIWKENRNAGRLNGDNVVVVDIETEESRKSPMHCPKHCTCGQAKQRLANQIDSDDEFNTYAVPLSPEDFATNKAMVAFGDEWLDICFVGKEDKDEFLSSYNDYLPKVDHQPQILHCAPSSYPMMKQKGKEHKEQHKELQINPFSKVFRQSFQEQRKETSASITHNKSKALEKQKNLEKTEEKVVSPSPQKRLSSDSERSEISVSLLKEIEKKIRAYNDEKIPEDCAKKSKGELISKGVSNNISDDRDISVHNVAGSSSLTPKKPCSKVSVGQDSSEKTKRNSQQNSPYLRSGQRSVNHITTRQRLRIEKRSSANRH